MALNIVSTTNTPVYSDIDPKFTRNPKNGDVLLVKNDAAVRTSLRNLLSTSFGERLFQPTIGDALRPLLFEPIDAITTLEIKDRVLQVIRNHEPRISNIVVDVIALPQENHYNVIVEYSVVGLGLSDKISVTLERIR